MPSVVAKGLGRVFFPDDMGQDAIAAAMPKVTNDLMFLHNTSAEKLARTQSMGGMPMPSLAVTKQDIPFEGFGDITLVGKPAQFDPKASKLNQAFSADAYTVRAPQPVRVARKGAGKAFTQKYGDKMKELGVYGDEVSSNIWDLERKGDADPSKYEQVKKFFTNQDDAAALFLDEKGIKVTGSDRFERARSAENKLKKYLDNGEFEAWGNERIDEVFSPEEYFISNPDRDYYTTGAKLKPYTADDITKFMKRSAGRGGEGGMGSVGAVRASTTEELKSLQGMRDIKDRLVSSEDMAEFKQTSDMMFDDLRDAFKGHYKYDSDGWGYLDEFAEFVKLSETKGIKAAGDEVGFDVPQGLADELNEYKDMLRGGATEYFESKPKRVVGLEEFGGAIVPEGTDPATMKMLERAGIQIEPYVDEASRLAARGKFKDYMFQGAGAATLGGVLYTPEQNKALADSLKAKGLSHLIPTGDKITADEFPKLEAIANFLDENTQTVFGPAFEGISTYLRGFGDDADAKQKAKRALGAALDLI